MWETEFGGLPWFSYAVLFLVLLIGYVILRFQQARGQKKKRSRPLEQRTALELELQAEIDAMERRKAAAPPREEPAGALEPPPEVARQMEELRGQMGGDDHEHPSGQPGTGH